MHAGLSQVVDVFSSVHLADKFQLKCMKTERELKDFKGCNLVSV
jgi:hypothetical protein